MSSPLEEILKRLEAMERRLARIEADRGIAQPDTEASNAAEFGGQPAAPSVDAEPAASAPPAGKVPEDPRVAVGDEPKSYSPTAIAPATERLHPLSTNRASLDAPFPDLSMLDEKVEPRKGPAELLDVRAAIEELPRIATRIQQLWGTPECERYINNLVIDTRGNRKGFPPAVMEELLYLGRLARALVILSVDGDLWDSLDGVGDRR